VIPKRVLMAANRTSDLLLKAADESAPLPTPEALDVTLRLTGGRRGGGKTASLVERDKVTRRPDPGGRRMTLEEAAAELTERHKAFTPGGRTLAAGREYDGRDIPGFGKAAARRLRQLAKKEQR
jgi:hypothetical protein